MPLNFDIADLNKLNEFVKTNDGIISDELLKKLYDLYYNSWLLHAHSFLKNQLFRSTMESVDLIKSSWTEGILAFIKKLSAGIDNRQNHCSTKTLLFTFCQNQLQWTIYKSIEDHQREKNTLKDFNQHSLYEYNNDFRNIFELKDLVTKALRQMNIVHRQYIVWFYLEKIPLKEIAILDNVVYGTAKNKLLQARETLKAIIQKIK